MTTGLLTRKKLLEDLAKSILSLCLMIGKKQFSKGKKIVRNYLAQFVSIAGFVVLSANGKVAFSISVNCSQLLRQTIADKQERNLCRRLAKSAQPLALYRIIQLAAITDITGITAIIGITVN